MLVSAGAKQDEEGLKIVEKQYEYLTTAVKDMNQALVQSAKQKPGKVTQQQQAPQPAQVQTNQVATAKRQLPAGYAVGRPAPFAANDPQQVARFQQFVGIQPTGRWDNNTQTYWNNWLKQTYQIA